MLEVKNIYKNFGSLQVLRGVSTHVEKGEVIARIGSSVPVTASIAGVLRGLIRDGYSVTKGLKIADIDPRADSYPLCFQISDKSKKIADSVLKIITETTF